MKSNFAAALADVLKHEGGFSNDPRDPGGATNLGVTQREYDSYRARHGWPLQSVRLIGPGEAAGVYREDYWDVCACDALPSGVDYAVFDFAVNSGTHRAVAHLQQVLGVDADGVIGPHTIAAAEAALPSVVIDRLCADRDAYLHELKTFGHFGHGWHERVVEVDAQAKAMEA
jgi:lysozyme family protein